MMDETIQINQTLEAYKGLMIDVIYNFRKQLLLPSQQEFKKKYLKES